MERGQPWLDFSPQGSERVVASANLSISTFQKWKVGLWRNAKSASSDLREIESVERGQPWLDFSPQGSERVVASANLSPVAKTSVSQLVGISCAVAGDLQCH